MTRRHRWVALAALPVLCFTGLLPAHAGGTPDGSPDGPEGSVSIERRPYPGDPEQEAALVADEDSRLIEVRTVDSLARLSKQTLNAPYRLATGSAYTLVLPARRAAYTVKDLLGLAPQTFVREPDGSFLLSEHLVVLSGATLNLTSSGGLTLRLASSGDSFVSLVNFGGRLNVIGAAGAPVKITSWDARTATVDRLTTDGRAYVRSIGGQVAIKHAQLSDLGFWSGRTGGLSLTGSDRPNPGALDKLGQTMRIGKRAERERAGDGEEAAAEPGLDGAGRSTLSEVLPAGELPVPTVDIDDPAYSFASATLQDVKVERNAYGLFVASANGVDIRRSAFDLSLVDGLVMHRYVTNAVVEDTQANRNGGDGMTLSRATTGIVLSQVTASRNGRNGVSLSGLPLADGPSATGISVGSYGNNSVANSAMSGNRRYGIEVIGGANIGVQANTLDGNDMGIVVREGARKVSVVGNRITNPARQGIAVRDGISGALVTGNVVTGGRTSVYVRDSAAVIDRNTLTGAGQHAVTFVGDITGTQLTENTISGRGPSAIDRVRAENVDLDRWSNDVSAWSDTTPFLVPLKRFLQPLTMLWISLALLVVFTAVRGTRSRRRMAHPYADKAPLGTAVPAAAQPQG